MEEAARVCRLCFGKAEGGADIEELLRYKDELLDALKARRKGEAEARKRKEAPKEEPKEELTEPPRRRRRSRTAHRELPVRRKLDFSSLGAGSRAHAVEDLRSWSCKFLEADPEEARLLLGHVCSSDCKCDPFGVLEEHKARKRKEKGEAEGWTTEGGWR